MPFRAVQFFSVLRPGSVAEGALLRYLAESVWFPTAPLPSPRLESGGRKQCPRHADATVSLEFHFNDAGEVTSGYAPGRPQAVGGGYEMTPWGGRHRSYEERDGMWIPAEAEVEWRLPDGVFPVWKGKTVEAEYDCSV